MHERFGAHRAFLCGPSTSPLDGGRYWRGLVVLAQGRTRMFHSGFGLAWLIAVAIAVVPFWRICSRVGHSPWLSLLIVVPLVNLIFIYWLAFAEWPSGK
jgi:hypothetical protein